MKTANTIKRPFVSPATYADQTGVGYETVLRAIHRGEIPVLRIGRQFRIPREALDRVSDDTRRYGGER
jgi:excisionase family DNA binding protein